MNPTVQLLMIAAMAFGLLLTVTKAPGGQAIVMILVVAAALSCVVVYLLRFDRPRASRFYALPGCRQFIDLVCRMSKEQPPPMRGQTDGSKSGSGKSAPDSKADENLLLKKPDDFARAERDLKYAVRGHSRAIDTLLDHLKRSVILRQRRDKQHAAAPLGVFLLVGQEGCGKKHLATVLAHSLYKAGDTLMIDGRECKEAATAMSDLFGSAGHCGRLISAVRARPQHTVIVEHADALAPKVLDTLRELFNGGFLGDEAGRPISFQDSLFVLCTTKCGPMLCDIDAKGAPDNVRRRQIVEALTTETPFEPPLVAQFTDVIGLERLSALAKAEVIGLLMQAECRKYKVLLDYVEAEVLADEVAAVSDGYGMKEAPRRVSRLLKPYLAEAMQSGRTRIVIARDEPDIETQMPSLEQRVG